jgi:hypothetical protein
MVERLSHKEEVVGSTPTITTMSDLTEAFKFIESKANLIPEPVAPAGKEEYGTPQEKTS